MARQYGLTLVAVIALGVAVELSSQLPTWTVETKRRSLRLAQPSAEVLALVSMNQALALADLAWLDAIQNFGSDDNDWPRIKYVVNLAADFDPRYLTVFDAGGLMLGLYAKDYDAAETLLIKGTKSIPDSFKLPFLIGYLEFFERHRPEVAADWMQKAGALPGAPRHLAALAGSLRARNGDMSGGIALLQSTIPRLTGAAREEAEWRLKAMQSEVRFLRFDAVCPKYKFRYGVPPTTGAELVQAGFIDEPAVDEFGEPITIDTECIARSKQVDKREFERFNPAAEGS
jgi:hypothetical protein